MSNWGPFSIEGKNAVVTGGAMGIGFGIAKRFVEGGANVLIADVDPKAAQAAAEKLKGGPGKVAHVAADISDDATPEKIVSACVTQFGGIDVLINNAGIYPSVPVLQMTPELFDRVQRINLRGLVFLSKAAAQRMIQQGRDGKIINIGSIDSQHPSMVGLAAYDSSKGGVLMFTRNFALEMAPHRVLVNTILPGGIATEGASKPLAGSGMTEAQMKEFSENFIKNKVPLGRMGVPDDIAKAAVFLASSGSDYMTGSSVLVDGGTLLT